MIHIDILKIFFCYKKQVIDKMLHLPITLLLMNINIKRCGLLHQQHLFNCSKRTGFEFIEINTAG
jgi:hypothetical protein